MRVLAPLICLLLVPVLVGQEPPPKASVKAESPPAKTTVDLELAEKLTKTKRIFVESFGEDPINKQLHAMVVDALNQTHRFIITENRDKADAILRGNAVEKTSQEYHAIGEGTAVGAAGGASSSSISGDSSGTIRGSSQSAFGALDTATSDSQASTQTINDARLSVRLVSSDGDVLWSTTQESKGAKYKGASADVADKIAKQLMHDLEKLNQPKEENQKKNP